MQDKKDSFCFFVKNRINLFLISYLSCSSYYTYISAAFANQELSQETMHRIHMHLILEDPASACFEARAALKCNPQDTALWKGYLLALTKLRSEKALIETWEHYTSLNGQSWEEEELIEAIAWATLQNAASSPSPVIRTLSLLGTLTGQDIRSVDLLLSRMRDHNALVRASAVQLASRFRDEKLRLEMMLMLEKEPHWHVRLQVIKAVGLMKIHEAENPLLAILSSAESQGEERAMAIEALVNLWEDISQVQLVQLISSDRAGLRELACQAIAYFDLKKEADLLVPLLEDYSPIVRKSALQTLGLLEVEKVKETSLSEIARQCCGDADPYVAISAGWLLGVHGDDFSVLEQWMRHGRQEFRLLAAAALAATGRKGVESAEREIMHSQDPYVRINLALGLIRQRKSVDLACKTIYENLLASDHRWGSINSGLFEAITPIELTPSSPLVNSEEMNQLIRLNLLNVLAIVKYDRTQELILTFLGQNSWTINAIAATLLLTRGDDAALESCKQLLNHPKKEIQIQAALILALWGRDEVSISYLQTAYLNADRSLKQRILEGIARVKSRSSIPFLMQCLKEPSQTLRIIAAASLIECLSN